MAQALPTTIKGFDINSITHLVDWDAIANAPEIGTGGVSASTISGYGITDAKIEGQVITLGENSITVPADLSARVQALEEEMGKITNFEVQQF